MSASDNQHQHDAKPGLWPTSVEDLIGRLLSLEERVRVLEEQLSARPATADFANLQKIEYKIGKLYVKDLSGTLNIGITSIGDAKTLTDLTGLAARESVDMDDGFDDESDIERLWIRESDADWTRDERF